MFSRTLRASTTATSRLSQISSHINNSAIQRRMASTTALKLNTGATIPALGFGTWQDKDDQEKGVAEALKAGYGHIDTAAIYGTEPMMHWPSAFKAGDNKFPKDANGKTETADISYIETWKAMEKLIKTGKTKAIGVSNFSKKEMEHLVKEASIPPAAHQIECHPWLQQKDFSDWHKSNGIHVQHYSPFGNQNEIYDLGKNMGKLMDDPVLVKIGKKHNKSGAQVVLAWGITRGHSVLPKSKTPARIQSNLDGDFKLNAEDMKKIESIDKKLRFNDPSGSFGYQFYTDLDGKRN
ncbi:probable GCY1 Galactose-induced protein of aldo/keto reductase family [Phialocephala subalpina]|uniref:Probable GCY1 Galactose-induced protein of aldo/keto reductase family n=1 Tax=Phialocephala subalpina TaxID=576137 RepID=A0A1L7X7C2_9HELO|nr:probable GCY1 Galactose-induced protein of aldo/keto reductase family [Phialocephala subalpina]